MPLCIAMDVDDTLFLERDYVRSGFAAAGAWASQWLGVARLAERAWEMFEEGARGNIFDRVLVEAGLNARPDLIQSLVWVYRTHYPDIRLAPDAASFLGSADGLARIAIITDGPAVSQSRKIEALGLERIADPIVITERWGSEYAKPEVKAFQMVARQYESDGMSFVYIGDNPAKDFAAPRNLGWTTVRVRRPGGLHSNAPNPAGCEAELEVFDLSGLWGQLGGRDRGI
jgi:putative hydrolase of the HAD superfamily